MLYHIFYQNVKTETMPAITLYLFEMLSYCQVSSNGTSS